MYLKDYKDLRKTVNSGNPFYKYDVVYLGSLLPGITNYKNGLLDKFKSEYVLIFETFKNREVSVKLEKSFKVSYFGSLINANTSFFLVNSDFETVCINENIELKKINVNEGFEVFAKTKYNGDLFIFRYFKERVTNQSSLLLAKEFDYKIRLDELNEQLEDITTAEWQLHFLDNSKDFTDEQWNEIEITKKLLDEKKRKIESDFNIYRKISEN